MDLAQFANLVLYDFDTQDEAINEMLNFTVYDTLRLGALPFFHKDPYDRMLIAQSMAHDYFLLSDDEKVKLYDCKVI